MQPQLGWGGDEMAIPHDCFHLPVIIPFASEA